MQALAFLATKIRTAGEPTNDQPRKKRKKGKKAKKNKDGAGVTMVSFGNILNINKFKQNDKFTIGFRCRNLAQLNVYIGLFEF